MVASGIKLQFLFLIRIDVPLKNLGNATNPHLFLSLNENPNKKFLVLFTAIRACLVKNAKHWKIKTLDLKIIKLNKI